MIARVGAAIYVAGCWIALLLAVLAVVAFIGRAANSVVWGTCYALGALIVWLLAMAARRVTRPR